MIETILRKVEKLDSQIEALKETAGHETKRLVEKVYSSDEVLNDTQTEYSSWSDHSREIEKLRDMRDYFLNECKDLAPDEKVFLARHKMRPHIDDFIDGLFGDRFVHFL